jgi:SAM-dependent methyltransferase
MKKLLLLSLVSFALHANQKCPTADNYTYYSRGVGEKLLKREHIAKFVLEHSQIQSIYDVGCNNGLMSEHFIDAGIDVFGIDASEDLALASRYQFRQVDVTREDHLYPSDCTLFLSVYHHMLSFVNREFADKLFFKLLLRSNYLVFDCGNPSELSRQDAPWMKAMKRYAKTEVELLESFGLPYEVIGQWSTGGGSRSLAVYQRKMFDEHVKVINHFKPLVDSSGQEYGLIDLANTHVKSLQIEDQKYTLDQDTHYYKLQMGNTLFLAKRGKEKLDKAHFITKLSSRSGDLKNALEFIGFSEKYGTIYEWRDGYEVALKTIQETESAFSLLNQLLPIKK